MTTLSEVYFLVRVGSWSETDLADYIQDQIADAESLSYDQGYETGHREGTEAGLEEGLDQMYQEALSTIRCLR